MRIITPPGVKNEVWLEAVPRLQLQAAEFSKVEVILQIAGPTKSLFLYAIQVYSPDGKDRVVYQLHDPTTNSRFSVINYWLGPWWMVWIPPGWSVEKVDRVPGILSELAARSLSSQAVPASQNILKNSSVEAGGAAPDNWQQGAVR